MQRLRAQLHENWGQRKSILQSTACPACSGPSRENSSSENTCAHDLCFAERIRVLFTGRDRAPYGEVPVSVGRDLLADDKTVQTQPQQYQREDQWSSHREDPLIAVLVSRSCAACESLARYHGALPCRILAPPRIGFRTQRVTSIKNRLFVLVSTRRATFLSRTSSPSIQANPPTGVITKSICPTPV